MSLSIVVLGAGRGTRMKSSTPKVLHKVSDKEMIFYPIEIATRLSDDITVVLFHQFDLVQSKILSNFKNIKIHKQDAVNFPGSGGALRGVKFQSDRVLILNGDMPLITEDSLRELIDSDADITMSVIELKNPSGYGRVIISKDNEVREIVEEKDCSPHQKTINTVNGGVYCVKSELLERYIPKLSNNNVQSEYYLTDIIKMAVDERKEG